MASFRSPHAIAYFSPGRAGFGVLFKAFESLVEFGLLLVGQLECFGCIRYAVPDCLNNPNPFGHRKPQNLVKRDRFHQHKCITFAFRRLTVRGAANRNAVRRAAY